MAASDTPPLPPQSPGRQVWVEPVGGVIIARVRGVPTETLLRDCQERVLSLVQETGCPRVLYDCLELEPPTVEVVLTQRKLDEAPAAASLRRSIVVPNTKLAYLARLAFGEGRYRVFYNDVVSAVKWLEET